VLVFFSIACLAGRSKIAQRYRYVTLLWQTPMPIPGEPRTNLKLPNRLARDGNALQSEAVSSISSGLSVVGKIVGHGALTIFGHVEGEVRASTIVIAEGARIEGKVSAEELTVGGYVKGTLHANRVKLNSTAVVKGDIIHRTLEIEGSDASMKSARAIVRWNR
jgi:cytoskeletal protein CcmA (bactofilin family)